MWSDIILIYILICYNVLGQECKSPIASNCKFDSTPKTTKVNLVDLSLSWAMDMGDKGYLRSVPSSILQLSSEIADLQFLTLGVNSTSNYDNYVVHLESNIQSNTYGTQGPTLDKTYCTYLKTKQHYLPDPLSLPSQTSRNLCSINSPTYTSIVSITLIEVEMWTSLSWL